MFRPILAVAAALLLPALVSAQERATAIFAGGCFWCVESDFDAVPGVTDTVSGFAGGDVADPSYEQIVAGGTGHRESVKITYDPGKVSYEELLDAFFRSVDPTDAGGQFCDRGESYTTAVFVMDKAQREAAEAAKAEAAEALDKPIATTVENVETFYPAGEYHQNYYEKNSLSYNFYRWNCGRDDRVEAVWGDEAYRGIPDHG